MSRRPNLGTASTPEETLSLPGPDAYGLSDPTGNTPPLLLASPLIPPNYTRPPMDHDVVLTTDQYLTDRAPIFMPHSIMPEDDLITCSNIVPPVLGRGTHRHIATEGHDDAIKIWNTDSDEEEDNPSRQCRLCLVVA